MIKQLIERLKAATNAYKTVEPAWSLDDMLSDISGDMPTALLYPGGAKSEPSPQMPVRQRCTQTVIVETICDREELESVRRTLYESLLGYQHTAHYGPLEHVEGQVRKISGRVVWYVDIFATQHWITGNRARIVATETDIPIASEDGDTIAAP